MLKFSVCANVPDQVRQETWHMLALRPDSDAAGVPEYVGRAWDQSRVSIELLRQWLEDCDRCHGTECRQPVIPRPSHRIMLIDTKRHCLIDSHGSENYAALSYVWGTTISFQTTKANLTSLREANSLLGVGGIGG